MSNWKKTLTPIKSAWVCCAASPNTLEEYKIGGFILGQQLAYNDIQLVYGAGEKGVMGSTAEGYRSADKEPFGVITKHLIGKEVVTGKNTSVCTRNMFDRKRHMMEMSDCYVFTAGGVGTLDEIFEVLTLRVIKEEDKPIYIYDPVNNMFADIVQRTLKDIQALGVIDYDANEHITYTDSVAELIVMIQEGLYKNPF